jgi:uncharacterized membrane protein YqjE
MNPGKDAAGNLGSYAYSSGKQGGPTVPERTITDIVKDTLTNIQDIIRSEVQLAKIEVKEEATKASAAAVMFGVAAVTGLLGFAFCCLCIVYALALVLPAWAAALIVGVGLFIIAGVAFSIGRERWKKVKMPEKTIFTVKEDIAWTHSPNKS